MKFLKAPDSAAAVADLAREAVLNNPALGFVALVALVAIAAAYAARNI